ncbi:MAG: 2-dehydropantoate 2-reductase [Candidatus Aminicenantes bacterium]|nr:2-dehydropantoate 2-reductase [Candidatus Aminicenantes bacterium]
MEKKKIVIIGLGPIGGICAAHLSAAGHIVTGIDPWEEHIGKIKNNGLEIECLKSIQASLQDVYTRIDLLKEKEFDYAAIAVKTPMIQEVTAMLESFGGGFKKIVVLQNGLDNEFYFANCFGRDRIFRMVVNYAGNIVKPGRIKMSFFQKPNRLGCLCSQTSCCHVNEFAKIMTDAGLDTEPTEDIKKYTWQKTILNSSITPLAALLDLTMSDVMVFPDTRNLVEMMLKEAIAVAKADGYDFGENFFDNSVNYLLNAGPHKPSMISDLKKGNPTEIEYINAKIVSYGKKYNVPVHYNAMMTMMVKARDFFGTERPINLELNGV